MTTCIMSTGLLVVICWELGLHGRDMHVHGQYNMIEPKTLWHPS